MKSIRLFIRLSRLIYILIAALLYLLGIGIAHYLSGIINWNSFFLGFIWLVLILLGFQYLNEYFDLDIVPENPAWWRTPFSGSSGALGPGKLPRPVALWAGLTCLTIVASITVLLYQFDKPDLMATIMLGLIMLGELILAIPPLHLVTSGYGELIMTLFRVGVIPVMAFLLQGHESHRLLIMVTIPLALLHLGMLLALEFPSYASDIQLDKKPILVRIGWQRGMLLHNLLILCSFIVFGLAFVLGLPLSLGWPVFFVLPVAVFQILMMVRIGEGAKPNWNLLGLTALSTFGMTSYILTYTFWIH